MKVPGSRTLELRARGLGDGGVPAMEGDHGPEPFFFFF